MSDLEIDRSYRRGDTGGKVKLIQEWLCLREFRVRLDGDFGPATETAVKQFQASQGLVADGVVGPLTFGKLTAPMRAALATIAPAGRTLGQLTVAYARQHLAQHPVEVGGQNRGPWVRLYMDGHEGDEWAWCAGFACFCLRQACRTLSVPMPIDTTFSCDLLAISAQQRGRFRPNPPAAERLQLPPGSFFLFRRTVNDWVHTGIVTAFQPEVFGTIEGNTNDSGSREGFEVCARFRSYADKDFVTI